MPRKILVVDDDKEWNFLLKMRLEMAGYKAEQAFNGKEALEKIRQGAPDLVLLDLTMPVMSGWDVCKAVREDPSIRSLLIIIHSSISQAEDIQRGKDFQVRRFLIKPCSAETVVQNVGDVLRQQQG